MVAEESATPVVVAEVEEGVAVEEEGTAVEEEEVAEEVEEGVECASSGETLEFAVWAAIVNSHIWMVAVAMLLRPPSTRASNPRTIPLALSGICLCCQSKPQQGAVTLVHQCELVAKMLARSQIISGFYYQTSLVGDFGQNSWVGLHGSSQHSSY